MKLAPRANIAALLIAVALLSLACAFLTIHLVTPSDGAFLQPGESYWKADGVVVTPLKDQPGGLQPGDVVRAIDGRSLESWAQALFRLDAPRPRWQFGQPIVYTVERGERRIEVVVSLGKHPLGAVVARNWSTILFGIVNQLVAAFVFWKRPRERAVQALFLAAAGMFGATAWSFGLTLGDIVGGIGFWLFKILTVGAYTLFFVASFHFALAFYGFRVPSWAVFCLYTIPFAFYPVYLAAVRPGAAGALDWLRLWIPGEGVFPAILVLGMILVTVYGYRTRRDPIVRQRIRWLIWATLVSGGGGLMLWLLPDLVFGHKIIDTSALGLIVLPFPLALAAAILRHHLFDIDVILNRTLVYGALTTIVAGVYVLIVGYLGTLFHVSGEAHRTADLVVSLVATGVVAVIFQPLRDRLQRAVNRLMYGERDDPYAVLSRLGQRLEATLAPDSALPAIVETVAQTLKLPHTAITLRDADADTVAAACGRPSPHTITFPLDYQHELIGHLHVAQRSPDEPFTPAERRLLEDIARQTAVVAHNVRLTQDLQHSRERIVTAREEERRRIRRDLHDGLGPALAAQTLKVGSARALFKHNPAASDALLAELEHDIDSALADIRRLVYDLRPPALDELGLVGAIRESVTQYHRADGLRLAVDVPGQLPPLPAAVEVAAYRITQEALTNVVRHAQARHCHIRIAMGRMGDHPVGAGLVPAQGDHKGSPLRLYLEITDDGVGLPPEHRSGVGLTSMRERAEELGGTCVIERRPEGGTRVAARLPIQSRWQMADGR